MAAMAHTMAITDTMIENIRITENTLSGVVLSIPGNGVVTAAAGAFGAAAMPGFSDKVFAYAPGVSLALANLVPQYWQKSLSSGSV